MSLSTTATAPTPPAPPRTGLRRVSLTQWILISLVVGIAVGAAFPDAERAAHGGFAASDLRVLGTIFIRMIKSLIVPLLFSTLVIGIAGHGDDMKKVGRLALRSIIYFAIVTTLALAVGLIAVNLVRPGDGITLPAEAGEAAQLANKTPTVTSVLEHTVPQSFFEAAASNEVLQIVFFSILFAVGLAKVEGRPKQVMLDWCDALSQVMFKFVGLVMAYAPIGIGAAIAVTVSKSGLGVLRNLATLVLTLYGALAVFILLVLVPVALLFRIPIKKFIAAVREPALIAFSTASSEAALPRAMQAMEAFGVPRRIVAFVMPTGYSFNLDGSTLYLALASVFAAQAAGIDMPLGTQILMMLTLMLTSKGVAAVPRASLVILSGALAQFGLPLSAVAVILGVDALMDMARTSVNLVGNCLATAVMARWEGVFGEQPALAAQQATELERQEHAVV
ncbi:dicarboxylate/amino acid:cation symporter [Roseisolibacter agri]|uniref:Glutamate/aspartate:proton symporter n=1 Tax=Roseisolibacter agri TaxID=2014610 RepID=A0AA37Q6U0_9BACT|nr:cation:dicarboxylase symporter family transporter [Roseisolibacter agri]GLC27604.1 glutamate/aspartate:proton symporter [Roseisolibacter agri]